MFQHFFKDNFEIDPEKEGGRLPKVPKVGDDFFWMCVLSTSIWYIKGGMKNYDLESWEKGTTIVKVGRDEGRSKRDDLLKWTKKKGWTLEVWEKVGLGQWEWMCKENQKVKLILKNVW